MNYIYGKLNYEVQKVEYEGERTETADVSVDRVNNKIAVDVLKLLPEKLPDNVVYLDLNNNLKIIADIIDNLNSAGLNGQALIKQNNKVVWSDIDGGTW